MRNTQYAILNDPEGQNRYYPLETELRSLSKNTNGKGFVLTVFDACRNDIQLPNVQAGNDLNSSFEGLKKT